VSSSKSILIPLTGLIALLLTACSGNTALEGRFAADPALQETPTTSPTVSPSTVEDYLPAQIPRYPNLTYVSTETGSNPEQKITRWTSSDPSNLIESYYQQELQAKNWQISQPFSNNQENNPLIARLDDLEVQITVTSSPSVTELTIAYQQGSNTVNSPTPTPLTTSLTFSDLEQVPQSLRVYVEDLHKLGILNESNRGIFNPNQPITRRDFAKWLLTANNKFYTTSAGKQIRTASVTNTPIFQDIPKTDPDFMIIQGLAEAGIIPSSLTGDSNNLLFRPNAPLTREDLLIWKVPLDMRKALKTLPSGSIDAIKQTWGFQDVAKMSPDTLRALYNDYQNGEQANVKRILGYTTLFQPQKPVTRAEAAAALWYFGYQGDGISAADVLQVPNT
jgi:hypothetical protein